MIKKNIIIILISAAIAVTIIFTDKIIQADRLEGPPPESVESIDNNAGDDAQDTDIIENEKKFDSDMIIDDSLFIQKQDIIAVPVGSAGGSKDEDPAEPEAFEENGEVSDTLVQEDMQAEIDSEQTGIVDDGDNIEAVPDENMEDDQQLSLNEENIDYSNSGDFRIEVDLARQRVIIFYKDDMLREMICSGGAPGSPTPMGEFITSQKIEYSFVARFDVGAYYWIRFFEDYLIHSVPFDENGEMIIEEFEKLGSPASHGCIRLKLEEAKWLYETLPLGVKVLIY